MKLKATKKKLVLPADELAPDPKEFVVTPGKGALGTAKVKQAGTDAGQDVWISQFRQRAERHLYVFTKSVLGRLYLTQPLHLPLCNFLQNTQLSVRKMALIPRECGKTSIVSHALPLHVFIQPREHNIYFPGEHGYDQRIVLASKAARLACDSLRTIQTESESNKLLKALWPDRFWADRKTARAQSKAWSGNELIFPRPNEWPDPHLRAVGVGAAITGSHPSMLIKDDLINEEDHSSPIVMATAIQWHTVSHALVNRPGCLEFVIGTRWHIHDLYQHIIDNEPSFKYLIRSLVETDDDGEEHCIYSPFVVTYPDGSVRTHGYSPEKIDELRREFGPMMFSLQYMNDARDPSLVDFDEKQLRAYAFDEGKIIFDDDDRDIAWADMRKAAEDRKKKPHAPQTNVPQPERQQRRRAAFSGRPDPLRSLRQQIEDRR